MKKISIILSLFFCVNMMIAQNIENEEENSKDNFSIGLDVFTDIWMNTPETLEPKTLNRGMSIFGMYAFPIGESNLSFVMGGGLTSHNLYSNSYLSLNTDGNSIFTEIPEEYTFEDTEYKITVEKNKLALTYFDVPIELRLKTDTKFMAALGLKVGFLLHDHSKYKGTHFEALHNKNGGLIKTKKYGYENLAKNRYGIYARIGYKSINLVGFYSLSTLFEENKGPEMYPISIGLSIIPF